MQRGGKAKVVDHYTKREVTLTGSELTTARKWRLSFPRICWYPCNGGQAGGSLGWVFWLNLIYATRLFRAACNFFNLICIILISERKG